MSRLRIGLVSTAAPDRPNGSMVRYAAMVREALERFAGDGAEVTCLNLAPPRSRLARFPVSLQTPVRYARIAAAARGLRRADVDVLHVLDGSHAYLLAAAGGLSVPVVCTVHDLIPALRLHGEAGMPPLGRTGAWLTRRTLSGLRRASAWVTDSGNTRGDLVRLAGVPADRVRVVHPAVALPDETDIGPPECGETPFILHVAGNNTFYKNRRGVIEVFALLRQSRDVALKMAGAPPDAALRDAAAASGAADRIEFLPNVSETELNGLYRRASFLLFPSLYEGFGWPPLEAMAQGCPVICSNAGSLPEVAGEAALVAPAGDTEAFAEAGRRLLDDPDLRRRLAAAGREQARRFSLEAMAAGLMEVYRSLGDGA